MTDRGDGTATAVDRIPAICAEIRALLASIEEQARQMKDKADDAADR